MYSLTPLTFRWTVPLSNELYSQLPKIIKLTLTLKPFEGFNWIFWHNLNNLNMLEGIYL